MNYRKGMKIRVRRELNENDPFGVTIRMKEFEGNMATVLWAGSNEHGKYVRLDVDREHHYWSHDMIEPLIRNKGREEG